MTVGLRRRLSVSFMLEEVEKDTPFMGVKTLPKERIPGIPYGNSLSRKNSPS